MVVWVGLNLLQVVDLIGVVCKFFEMGVCCDVFGQLIDGVIGSIGCIIV